MQPKDYDSTLVRVAGNIAAGLAGNGRMEFGGPASRDAHDDEICDRAMSMAQGLIARARRVHASSTSDFKINQDITGR